MSLKAEIERSLYGRKYKNQPTQGFASKREAELGASLAILEAHQKIFELKRQVRFVLVPAQKGVLRNEKELAYVCDFTYLDAEHKLHVLDAKGKRTAVFIIKRKLMKFVHGVEVEEV